MAEATKEPGKKPIDRVIRVFVSSTFADMHAEREELVKRVFPGTASSLAEIAVLGWAPGSR
jgi:hypothetical protein